MLGRVAMAIAALHFGFDYDGSVVTSTLHVAGKGPAYVLGRRLPRCCFRSCLASGIPLIPVVFCAGRARCRWLGMEFLLRTLAAGIVLTEYFPAVDDGVVTDGPTLPSRSVRIARALRFPSSVMCSGCGWSGSANTYINSSLQGGT